MRALMLTLCAINQLRDTTVGDDLSAICHPICFDSYPIIRNINHKKVFSNFHE